MKKIRDITELSKKCGYITTREGLGRDIVYRKLCKGLTQVNNYCFHGDYWGDAYDYREDNVNFMRELKPYINKICRVDNKQKAFKVIGMLIDTQYNSLKHTDILVEYVED